MTTSQHDTAHVSLYNPIGALVAQGTTGSTNLHEVISDFIAATSGNYYLLVSGGGADGADYNLVVTRNAEFDAEMNNSFASAQSIASTPVAGRQWALGAINPGRSGLYSTASYGSELISIDPESGAGSLVGPFGSNNSFGLAFTPDGQLWTFEGNFSGSPPQLANVNPETGELTPVGSAVATNVFIAAMDADSSGNLFAVGDSVLYLINTTSGQLSPVGPTGISGLIDLSFDDNGTLWATDFYSNLYTIDVSTGVGTFRTSISGTGFNSPYGLMVDPSDNSFYVSTYWSSNFYRLDPNTGVATLIGPMGIGTPAGADFAPAIPGNDFYKVNVDQKKTLDVQTMTPASKSGEVVNTLDPMIRIYNAAGVLVAADDNSATDHRNARIKYKVPKGAGGTYYIEVLASTATAEPTTGEYILNVKHTSSDGDELVAGSSPTGNPATKKLTAAAVKPLLARGPAPLAACRIRCRARSASSTFMLPILAAEPWASFPATRSIWTTTPPVGDGSSTGHHVMIPSSGWPAIKGNGVAWIYSRSLPMKSAICSDRSMHWTAS